MAREFRRFPRRTAGECRADGSQAGGNWAGARVVLPMVVPGEAPAVALVLGQAAGALPPAVLVPLLGIGSGGGPERSRQGRWDAQAGRPL